MLAVFALPSTVRDRRSSLRRATLSASLVLAVAAPAADAGSLTTRPTSDEFEVVYVAAPGEVNDVALSFSDPAVGVPVPSQGGTVTVVDAGAEIVPEAPCHAVDAHTAACPPVMNPSVVVELGDHDDHLTMIPGRGPNAGTATNNSIVLSADGGPGADVLDARNGMLARLDGGGGVDRLIGTDWYDVLTDGDVSGSAGPDFLDGGGGTDEVDYSSRTAPVAVDLSDGRPDGEAGEGDTLVGFENVTGGVAGDQLTGDDSDNTLVGGRGRDVLAGWGGDDVFGSWAGPVAENRRAAGDRVRCANGQDTIVGPGARDVVGPMCEYVVAPRWLPFITEGVPGRSRHNVRLPANPSLERRFVTYRVRCSYMEDWEWEEWSTLRCGGRLTLREASPRGRVLARGPFTQSDPWDGELVARLRLTAVGINRLAKPGGAVARLRLHGRHIPDAAWTVRLRR